MVHRLAIPLGAAGLLMAWTAPSLAQPGSQRPDEVSSYLEAKRRVFSQSERASQTRGSAQHVVPISNLLKERSIVREGGVRGRDAAEKTQVAEALRTTVAYFLVSVGHTPNSVRAFGVACQRL